MPPPPTIDNEASLSVGDYFSQAFLPEMTNPFSNKPLLRRFDRAIPWPLYPELNRKHTSSKRTFTTLCRPDTTTFLTHVHNFKKRISGQAYVKIGDEIDEIAAQNLRLPSKGFCDYADEDLKRLSNVHNEQLFKEAMEYYVFGTVREGLRVIMNQSPITTIPADTLLGFTDYRSLSNARYARWDVLALEIQGCPPSIFVFITENQSLGTKDFADLVEPRPFNKNELNSPTTIAETLWALIHDTCKTGGRYFAITNYTQWAFGEISRSGEIVGVSQVFDASILLFDGTCGPVQALRYNVVEMLLYWSYRSLVDTLQVKRG